MLIRLIFTLLLSHSVYAETLCTEKMKGLHPTVAATCGMYDEVEGQTVEYIPNAGDIDYRTETSHKLYLQSQFFPGSSVLNTIREHFGYYEKIGSINPENQKTLMVLGAPMGAAKEDLYCNADFDIFTPLTFTDRHGQKQTVLNFLERGGDIVAQVKKIKNDMGVDRKNGAVPVGINDSFDLYCGKLKTNQEVTYGWETPECAAVRTYSEGGGDQTIKNELASGNIYVRSVYVGGSKTPKKVCTIRYKKEVQYESDCKLQPSDITLNPGETVESKMVMLKEKYTSAQCCGKYPNAYLYIENPFDLLLKNSKGGSKINELAEEFFGPLNLDSKIKCVINRKSSGYETKHLIPKEVEPVVKEPFNIGCGGITYTGVYEQNVIDRLNNYKEILNEVASPYTKCCDENALSNIQKYGYIYAVTQCTEELAEMATGGTYNGVKVSDSIADAVASCNRHFSDTDVKAGGMGNSSLANVGGRITQGLSSAQNYVGCLSEEISDMEIIKKFKGCVDSNYEEFMDFINWLVSQQLTLNIGVDRFMGEVCRDELDKSSSIDLSFNLGDFTGSADISSSKDVESSENAATLKDTLRIEEGGNYYGVIKTGNQYLPALTLQDKFAFQTTNLGRPFGGLDSKEHPTFLYAELHDLLGLSYNIPNVTDNMNASLACKQGAFDNIRELVGRKLGTLKEIKTIDGYIYMYANNAKLLITGEVRDIGIFANLDCSTGQKEEILEFFNLALKKYIKAYLSNKVNTLKEAELGLIKQELIHPPQFNYGVSGVTSGNNGYVGSADSSRIEGVDYDEKLVVPDAAGHPNISSWLKSRESHINGLHAEIREKVGKIKDYFSKKRTECLKRHPIKTDYEGLTNCVKTTDATILQMGRDVRRLALEIVKNKKEMIKHGQDNGLSLDASDTNVAVMGMTTIAKEFQGLSYIFGSNPEDMSSYDCSSFTQYLYSSQGVNLPRTAYDQFKSSKGIEVSKRDLKPGDLVFFKGSDRAPITHVGVFVGNKTHMIHAAGIMKGIRTDDINGKYYRNTYRGARRFLKSNNVPAQRAEEAHSQLEYGPVASEVIPQSAGYDEEKYREAVEKYTKEEADKGNPMYLKKKSLEIYQSLKRNKEIRNFKNTDLLKKSIGVF